MDIDVYYRDVFSDYIYKICECLCNVTMQYNYESKL